MGPASEKEKAYHLFRDALDSSAKIAIGTFVMREKEYVGAISPYREGLLLSTLNYGYEIRDVKAVENLDEPVHVKAEEVRLASQLISRLYKPSFDISVFKDRYMEELKKLLQRKAKGEVITVKEVVRRPQKEGELIEALKASLK